MVAVAAVRVYFLGELQGTMRSDAPERRMESMHSA
jgi:hypothetical protein